MSQLRQSEHEFKQREVTVLVVTFDDLSLAQHYRTKYRVAWPMLLDPELTLYHAYGMPRGKIWDLINPLVMVRYVVTILQGHWPKEQGKDLRQMGGNVLIDPKGIVQLNHVSQNPYDRPRIDEMLKAIDEANSDQDERR